MAIAYEIEENSMKRVKEGAADLLINNISFWLTDADRIAAKRPMYRIDMVSDVLLVLPGPAIWREHPNRPRRSQWLTTEGKWKVRLRFDSDKTDPEMDLLLTTDVLARDPPPVHDPAKELHKRIKVWMASSKGIAQIMDEVPSRFSPDLQAKVETDEKPDNIKNMRRDGVA